MIYYETEEIREIEIMDAWLHKRVEYKLQKEYRFAFLKGSPAGKIQCITFYVREPKQYIQSIYFGPKMTRKQKRELLVGAMAADVAGCIKDFDEHFG